MAPGCRPHSPEWPANGAIAQLGERVVRNDEVGGSIPPGSTTLRPSGYAWRSHEELDGRSVVSGEARRAKTDWLRNTLPYLPVNLGGRFSMKLATPSRKSLPASATIMSRFASIVASASVWNGTS